MLISVSFSPLENHLSILEQETATVQRLKENLELLYQQAVSDLSIDGEMLRGQIDFADIELMRIQKRKELLKLTLDVFKKADEEYDSTISEVRAMLRKTI